jgi:uncharacterized membrane protein SirB2
MRSLIPRNEARTGKTASLRRRFERHWSNPQTESTRYWKAIPDVNKTILYCIIAAAVAVMILTLVD